MKHIKITALLFISLLFNTGLVAGDIPDINLSAGISKGSAPSSYELNYSIYFSNFDPSVYMDQEILYPEEFLIAEGSIKDGVISEKDFLSSERNYDLNGDGDTSDTFTVAAKGGNPVIAGKAITPLYRKVNSVNLLLPLDEKLKEKSTRIGERGCSFTIHSFDRSSGKLIAGIGKGGEDVIFRKHPNSLLIIEIIRDGSGGEAPGIMINSSRAAEGFTNETAISGTGEPLRRYSFITGAEISSGRASGTVTFSNLSEPFTLRVKYCFAVSGRVIIISEKIIKAGKE